MRPLFTLLLSLFVLPVLTAQVFDSFTDGNFTDNPQWTGTTGMFTVNELQMLQLTAPAETGKVWLFTKSGAVENAQWQFYFKMDFNPSASNYAEVYLTADHADINTVENSFYIVLGTASDNISLWEKRAGHRRRLIEGVAGRLNIDSVSGVVRVKRESSGLFVLESNIASSGWTEEGRYSASEGMMSACFGVSCHYTQTRSSHFFFDDIEITGEPYNDTIPPTIVNFEVKNRYTFRLRFSKSIEKLVAKKENFTVSPSGSNPDNLLSVEGDACALDLHFNSGIPVETEAQLTVQNLNDIWGNTMPELSFPYSYQPAKVINTELPNLRTILFELNRAINFEHLTAVNFRWKENDSPAIVSVEKETDSCLKLVLKNDFPNGDLLNMYLNSIVALNGDTVSCGPYPLYVYQSSRNDIVITEIMTDPSPAVQLPDCEYIELCNRSEFPVQLKGFTLAVGDHVSILPEYLLYPHDYLLLIPSSQIHSWQSVPNRLAVTSWQPLPNSIGEIVLYDKSGNTVTALRYSTKTGFKQEGGWSLEIKDADNLSGDRLNLDFSVHPKGGTPGAANSIQMEYPDAVPPLLLNNYISNDSCIVIEFSEPVNSLAACTTEPQLAIHSVCIEEPFLTTAKICFNEAIPVNRQFEFHFSTPPADWAGNLLTGTSFPFGIPVTPEGNEIIINELLYNPPPEGSDYVELYNRSGTLIDLSQLYLASGTGNDAPDKLVPLSTVKKAFLPESYLAFTSNREWILNHYFVDNHNTIRHLPNLPSYTSGNGTVLLTSQQGNVFERFNYNDKMHFPLLSSTKGVALERINPHAAATSTSNWHSAAATQNYGTPGAKNSQSQQLLHTGENSFITVEPQVFTPNQDGTDDLLFIHYQFNQSGNSCTVTVFDHAGHAVRHLENNTLAGTKGFFTWDGTSDSGHIAPTGIYIIKVRAFYVDGELYETKKTAVLGYGSH